MNPEAEAEAHEWREQAVRVHRRYVLEIVEASGLCPWAVPARTRHRVREAVLLQRNDTAYEESFAALDRWTADEQVEVGFLLYPRIALGARDFDAFTARLRAEDGERHPLGEIPFVLAAFHPDAEPDPSAPERLIPFLRRTPDPCIQVVRASVLDKVRSGTPQGTQLFAALDLMSIEALVASAPPLRERIACTNLDTVRRMGIDALREQLDAIKRDRDATYAALIARERTAGA